MISQVLESTGQISTLLTDRINSWAHAFVSLIPNIVVAVLFLGVFFAIASFVSKMISRKLKADGRENLGEVLSSLIKYAIIIFSLFVAITLIAPSMRVVDLVASLGVGSIAVGFAFKDILQNWLCGLLILIRQPFKIGDTIKVANYEGGVEKIEGWGTVIKTFDAQKIVIPNSTIYSSPLIIRTAYSQRLSYYDVEIDNTANLAETFKVILDSLKGIDSVSSYPEPEILVWGFSAKWTTLRIRWWTNITNNNLTKNRSCVIEAIRCAFEKSEIKMSFQRYLVVKEPII